MRKGTEITSKRLDHDRDLYPFMVKDRDRESSPSPSEKVSEGPKKEKTLTETYRSTPRHRYENHSQMSVSCLSTMSRILRRR